MAPKLDQNALRSLESIIGSSSVQAAKRKTALDHDSSPSRPRKARKTSDGSPTEEPKTASTSDLGHRQPPVRQREKHGGKAATRKVKQPHRVESSRTSEQQVIEERSDSSKNDEKPSPLPETSRTAGTTSAKRSERIDLSLASPSLARSTNEDLSFPDDGFFEDGAAPYLDADGHDLDAGSPPVLQKDRSSPLPRPKGSLPPPSQHPKKKRSPARSIVANTDSPRPRLGLPMNAAAVHLTPRSGLDSVKKSGSFPFAGAMTTNFFGAPQSTAADETDMNVPPPSLSSGFPVPSNAVAAPSQAPSGWPMPPLFGVSGGLSVSPFAKLSTSGVSAINLFASMSLTPWLPSSAQPRSTTKELTLTPPMPSSSRDTSPSPTSPPAPPLPSLGPVKTANHDPSLVGTMDLNDPSSFPRPKQIQSQSLRDMRVSDLKSAKPLKAMVSSMARSKSLPSALAHSQVPELSMQDSPPGSESHQCNSGLSSDLSSLLSGALNQPATMASVVYSLLDIGVGIAALSGRTSLTQAELAGVLHNMVQDENSPIHARIAGIKLDSIAVSSSSRNRGAPRLPLSELSVPTLLYKLARRDASPPTTAKDAAPRQTRSSSTKTASLATTEEQGTQQVTPARVSSKPSKRKRSHPIPPAEVANPGPMQTIPEETTTKRGRRSIEQADARSGSPPLREGEGASSFPGQPPAAGEASPAVKPGRDSAESVTGAEGESFSFEDDSGAYFDDGALSLDDATSQSEYATGRPKQDAGDADGKIIPPPIRIQSKSTRQEQVSPRTSNEEQGTSSSAQELRQRTGSRKNVQGSAGTPSIALSASKTQEGEREGEVGGGHAIAGAGRTAQHDDEGKLDPADAMTARPPTQAKDSDSAELPITRRQPARLSSTKSRKEATSKGSSRAATRSQSAAATNASTLDNQSPVPTSTTKQSGESKPVRLVIKGPAETRPEPLSGHFSANSDADLATIFNAMGPLVDTRREPGDFKYKLKEKSVTEIDGHPLLVFMLPSMRWVLIKCPAFPEDCDYHPGSHTGLTTHLARAHDHQFQQYAEKSLQKLAKDYGKAVDMNTYYLHDQPNSTEKSRRPRLQKPATNSTEKSRRPSLQKPATNSRDPAKWTSAGKSRQRQKQSHILQPRTYIEIEDLTTVTNFDNGDDIQWVKPPNITDTLDFKCVVVAIGKIILETESRGSKAGETIGFMPLLGPEATDKNTAAWLSGLDNQSSTPPFLLQDIFDTIDKTTGRKLFKVNVAGGFKDSETNSDRTALRDNGWSITYSTMLNDILKAPADECVKIRDSIMPVFDFHVYVEPRPEEMQI